LITRRLFMLTSLAGLALAPAACKQSDTVLVIFVAAPRSVIATQLGVTVTAGIDTRFFLIPPNPEPGDPIAWPCSFTLSLDRAHMGPITVSVDARDAEGSTLAFGTTTMQHVQIGGQTDISVMLSEALPPDGLGEDGGADGAGGTDGQAGGGGAGDGGADGAAGQGGAAGQDASVQDAPYGETGLDGATD
jgi:hypothetical protein